jgi:hypothetical protein
MCRGIRHLQTNEIPTTGEDIRAATLQFVRKVSGHRKPSKVNEAAIERAVDGMTEATQKLLSYLSPSESVGT